MTGKTGTAEKVVPLPGYPIGHQEDQAWWCGWARSTGTSSEPSGAQRAPIVVCAVIENGGHGGAVADLRR